MITLAEKWHSVVEVATRFGVSPQTVMKAIKDGRLEAVKVGSKLWRVSEEALATWINEETRKAGE